MATELISSQSQFIASLCTMWVSVIFDGRCSYKSRFPWLLSEVIFVTNHSTITDLLCLIAKDTAVLKMIEDWSAWEDQILGCIINGFAF